MLKIPGVYFHLSDDCYVDHHFLPYFIAKHFKISLLYMSLPGVYFIFRMLATMALASCFILLDAQTIQMCTSEKVKEPLEIPEIFAAFSKLDWAKEFCQLRRSAATLAAMESRSSTKLLLRSQDMMRNDNVLSNTGVPLYDARESKSSCCNDEYFLIGSHLSKCWRGNGLHHWDAGSGSWSSYLILFALLSSYHLKLWSRSTTAQLSCRIHHRWHSHRNLTLLCSQGEYLINQG